MTTMTNVELANAIDKTRGAKPSGRKGVTALADGMFMATSTFRRHKEQLLRLAMRQLNAEERAKLGIVVRVMLKPRKTGGVE